MNALTPKPPFNVLIVMNKDRLGREQYQSAYSLKRLAQAGVHVFETSTSASPTSSTDEGDGR